MDLEHLWRAGHLDPVLGQDGHELLAPRLHLLARIPDLADRQVLGVGAEAHVVVEPFRREAGCLDLGVAFVVSLGGQVGWLETYNDAHGNPLVERARGARETTVQPLSRERVGRSYIGQTTAVRAIQTSGISQCTDDATTSGLGGLGLLAVEDAPDMGPPLAVATRLDRDQARQ